MSAADRQTGSLAGLAVALFLVLASLYVLHRLAAKAAIEDCPRGRVVAGNGE